MHLRLSHIRGNMKNATDRQLEILNYISGYIREKNYSPSFREVAHNFNIGLKGAVDHIHALQKKGYVQLTEGVARSIVILERVDERI